MSLDTVIVNPTSHTPCAVSWHSIIAGAFAAAALSIVLLTLGSGLGFASISPYKINPSATTIAVSAIIWLIVTQWLSSALGGYLSGRLHKKWVGLSEDEICFRDTSRGFLTWAVATVITVGVLSSAAFGLATSGITAAGAAASGDDKANESSYYVDRLLRTDRPAAGNNEEAKAEVGIILARSLKNGEVTPADKAYVAKVISARSGLTQEESAKRIDEVVAEAKDAANKARKAAAMFAIFTSLAMLIGAFIASVSGALGGKCRDEC